MTKGQDSERTTCSIPKSNLPPGYRLRPQHGATGNSFPANNENRGVGIFTEFSLTPGNFHPSGAGSKHLFEQRIMKTWTNKSNFVQQTPKKLKRKANCQQKVVF